MGSKLLSIILVPLYARYLTTSEYGMVDIVITTSSMLLPIISLSIYEATLRFTLDKDENTEKVLSNSVILTIIGAIVSLIIYYLIKDYSAIDKYLIYIILILILQSFQVMFAQYTRAIGLIKLYSINGVLMTIVMGGLNILFLAGYNLGVNGYFYSVILSNIASIIFLNVVSKLYREINFFYFDSQFIKKMLIYSIPLIPNAFMWWIMNATSKYLILYFDGSTENGLFAVANKIPSLLTMITTIFFQAWQLLAIEENDNNDRSETYNNVFYYFSIILFIATSILLLVLKPVMNSMFSQEFYVSWKYVPLLLFGALFSSYSNFFAITYNAVKETKGVLITSFAGGLVNIVFSVLLIPFIGTYGAGVSTILGFLIMWLLRLKDTERYINFNLDKKNLIANFLLLMIQATILFFNYSMFVEFTLQFFLFIIILVLNKSFFNKLYSFFRKIK